MIEGVARDKSTALCYATNSQLIVVCIRELLVAAMSNMCWRVSVLALTGANTCRPLGLCKPLNSLHGGKS